MRKHKKCMSGHAFPLDSIDEIRKNVLFLRRQAILLLRIRNCLDHECHIMPQHTHHLQARL